jgi:hypothetical protein
MVPVPLSLVALKTKTLLTSTIWSDSELFSVKFVLPALFCTVKKMLVALKVKFWLLVTLQV